MCSAPTLELSRGREGEILSHAPVVGLFPALDGLGGVQASGREAWAGIVTHLGDDLTHLLEYRAGESKTRAVLSAMAARRGEGTLLAWHLQLLKLAPLAARSSMRVVVFLHGIEAWRRQDLLTRRALRKVSLFLSNSHYTWERFAIANPEFRDKRHGIVPLGMGAVAGDAYIPPPASQPVALMLGRMLRSEDYKGHRQTIEAWPRVLDRVQDAALWIAGDGDLRPELERLARERGLGEHVRFWGAISEAQKERLLAQCRCLAMPSRGEGFGLVYLEAMRLGRPCLIGNGDAAREVVNPPECGLAVEPSDPAQIADAAARLLDAGPEWEHWSHEARRRYETQFTGQLFRTRLNSALFEVAQALLPAAPTLLPAQDTPVRPPRKILHVIPSVGPQRGGPSSMMRTIARGLSRAGMEVHIATTDDDGPERLNVPLAQPCHEDGATFWYFPRQTSFYNFSWPLTQWLAAHIREFDLVHIHALFSYAALPAAFLAHRAGVPYIVRPLGTLNRWGIRNRRPWLKRLSFRLIESRILKGAAGIHYTSEQELDEARELGVSANPLIIPNAVELPACAAHTDTALRTDRQVILFLSRFDRKKGLDLLLQAFALVRDRCPEALLVLAGAGDPALTAPLRADSQRLGIAEHVVWAGFLSGEEKWTALADADVFVLPSYSENFGVALVEALACGCPAVLSDQVGIHLEVARAGAGLVTRCNADELAQALCNVLTDPGLRRRMSENGVRLARQRFSRDAVSRRLMEAYAKVAP